MSKMSALRYGRIAVQAVIFTLLTLCLVGVPVMLAAVTHWQVTIQLVPAVLSLSLGTFVVWMIITLIFGRVYCSTVCPYGVMLDIVALLRRKRRYRYRRGHINMAIAILVLTIGVSLLGYTAVLQLIDPYSQYGRMVLNVLRPSLIGAVVAVISLAVGAVMAWQGGRRYCNTLCPVGGALSLVSRVSFFHIEIDPDKCVRCMRCANVCKAECINVEQSTVDVDRCVVCFNCLTDCPNSAIRYTPDRKQLSTPMFQRAERRGTVASATSSPTHDAATGTSAKATHKLSRRDFLTIAGALTAGAALTSCGKKAAKVMAATGSRDVLVPTSPSIAVTPPGAISRKLFLDRCTGCGLCMSRCPSGVLRPAVSAYGLMHPLTPTMDYDRARCLYDCNLCTTLCPTGALQPLDLPQKKLAAIGLAQVTPADCIHCGRCARACPTGAITMSQGAGPIPIVDPTLCIGCGACQQVCPAKPYKAIVVNGLTD